MGAGESRAGAPARTQQHGRNSTAAYLARKLGAFVEHVDALVVLELHDGVCGICGGDVDPQDFHVDHVVPLARGGLHCYANVQPAHPACNQRKFTKLMEELEAPAERFCPAPSPAWSSQFARS